MGFVLSVALDRVDMAISLFENSLLRRRHLHQIDCRLPLWLGSSVTWISKLELGLIGDSARNSVRLLLRKVKSRH